MKYDDLKEIRTRFAPSPTGYMHLGNLRTALYSYLLAKKKGGKFILRIEDTDQKRYVEGAEKVIYDTLHDCGMFWDEGPDVGGEYGPYVQSERMKMYREYAEKLVSEGKAYYCFCTAERMDEIHAKQKENGEVPHYDRHCRDLSPEESAARVKAGEMHVIRQKIPYDGTTTFNDEIYGDITFPNKELDDQILIKSDNMPTYNFANVVDDHTMDINLVVRGNEYLSSTPKYNLLYEAFGWQPPVYIHVEQIMRDKQHKLSKRDGDAYYGDFIKKGYLKDAVINYIALLGWAPKGENEIFSLDGLTEAFDVSGISKSPAIFDEVKMRAINGMYVRLLTPLEYKKIAVPYIRETCKREDIDIDLLCTTLQPRTEVLTDIPPQVDFIDALPEYDNALFINKKMKTDETVSKEMLEAALPVLENLDDFSQNSVHEALFSLIERLEVKNGKILYPLRVALSGKQLTPCGGVELAVILGKVESLKRIRFAIEKLS